MSETNKQPSNAIESSNLLDDLQKALRNLNELRVATSESWGWDDEWDQVTRTLERATNEELMTTPTE